MQIDFTTAFFILAALIVVLFGWLAYLHIKIRGLLKGSHGASLEDSIVHSKTEIEDLREFEKECLAYFTDVERRLGRSVQAVETVRFNAFKGTGEGGNQSFSTALLSERGDGVIVSSLYSRDHIGIFSKPISKFASQFDLTEEEREAINSAKANLKTPGK